VWDRLLMGLGGHVDVNDHSSRIRGPAGLPPAVPEIVQVISASRPLLIRCRAVVLVRDVQSPRLHVVPIAT